MRSSFPARSSKARATAVMASTPPRRSYREPSTVPTSCTLVTNGPMAFPASHILKPFNPGQVDLYLLLSDRTAGPGRRVGHGSSKWAFEATPQEFESPILRHADLHERTGRVPPRLSRCQDLSQFLPTERPLCQVTATFWKARGCAGRR